VPATSHPGQASRESVRDVVRTIEQTSRGGPGDKAEVHVSEEELGVTTQEADNA